MNPVIFKHYDDKRNKICCPKSVYYDKKAKNPRTNITAMIGENLKAKKFMTCVETVEKVQILLFIEIHI